MDTKKYYLLNESQGILIKMIEKLFEVDFVSSC